MMQNILVHWYGHSNNDVKGKKQREKRTEIEYSTRSNADPRQEKSGLHATNSEIDHLTGVRLSFVKRNGQPHASPG